MDLVITQTSNHGSSNAIVARLSLQAKLVLSAYPIPKEDSMFIWGKLHDVQKLLLHCYDLQMEIASREMEILNKQPLLEADKRVIHLATVEKLEEKTHAFLYSAKLCLRDLKAIITQYYAGEKKRVELNDSDYGHFSTWADGFFGANTEIAKLLREDCVWITEVFAKRNAVEHPGGKKGGILKIENFAAHRDSNRKWEVRPPVWKRNDFPVSAISSDMVVIIGNILTFSEDLLIAFLRHRFPDVPVRVLEIPENERDPKCPIRLQLTLDPEWLKTRKCAR